MNNHHLHRPLRLSVPPRTPTSRLYPQYPLNPYSSSFPFSPSSTPTPSKRRSSTSNPNSSLSSLFLLLFSLRSLYPLLPFLRSNPSFSLFPFSFLFSLLSFSLSLTFSLFSPSKETLKPPPQQKFSLTLTLTLLSKSALLALIFLLRFQALRSCGTAATILAEFSGNLAGKFISDNRNRYLSDRASKVRGFSALLLGLFLLSNSWDRIGCFPFSSSNDDNKGNCFRVLPMLLPFLSGFLGFYERSSSNWGALRQLGRKRVRLFSLFLTTVLLFFPAVISFFTVEGDSISVGNLGWNLANTVVFGVILSENYGEEKLVSARDLHKDFVVTFICTLVLELFYFPELSLLGFLFCGLLLWISVRELGSPYLNFPELGSGSSESVSSMILNPIRHILSERKSRKIALFLFINTAYMVVEFVAGFMSNSLGLISDACHMLFDCAALAIGLYASYISRLPANNQFNYGRGRFEVLSGYVNAVFLVLVGALIVLESFERILDPQEISTNSLLTVSIGGLVVNVVGLMFFHEEHHHAHHVHGGAGCSHSHSHQHHHDHHHHPQDHVAHDHEPHYDHHQSISVALDSTHEKSCGNGHDHHDHDHLLESDTIMGAKDSHSHQEVHPIGLLKNSNTGYGLHNHNHHDHNDNHGENGTTGNHQDHHCHGHQHDHHDHIDHHPNQSSGELEHVHENPIITSSDCSHNHSHGGDTHCESHVHKESCSHTNSVKSDSFSHSTSRNSSSQLKESSSEAKLQKEPRKHRHIDHNMEGIFLHVLADTLGSVGVVISTLLIQYKGWVIADPACSIFISILIVSSVIPLLRNSAEILLQRVPRVQEQDMQIALDDIMRIKGVCGIQNMHIWSFTNTDVVGTLHLHVSAEIDKASTKEEVSHILHDAGIKDLTIQVECVRSK
ncbi:zinc transporter-like protein [Tasmannia lanceolata]|uniref:zinc transporter-like protein n=1 Tax=Tasmannia lanceolata TaxID=3420 RepID=UPI004064B96C